jgi:hypothetical protein
MLSGVLFARGYQPRLSSRAGCMFMHRPAQGERPQLPHIARQLQHDVPVPPLDAA